MLRTLYTRNHICSWAEYKHYATCLYPVCHWITFYGLVGPFEFEGASRIVPTYLTRGDYFKQRGIWKLVIWCDSDHVLRPVECDHTST